MGLNLQYEQGNYYYGEGTDDNPLAGGGYGGGSGTTLQQVQQILDQRNQTLNMTQIIGVFVGEKIMYGTTFIASFEENVYLQRLQQLDEYVVYNAWYEIDIRTPCQSSLTTHSLNILLNTVSTSSLYSHNHPIFLTHFLNPPSPPTLSTHSLNAPCFISFNLV